MNKFYGKVGYSETFEKLIDGESTGVWVNKIVERPHYGDVIRNIRKLDGGENFNPNIKINNSISIIADPYATEHFFAIRYVEWMGARWTVDSVEVQSPRLILSLGGVYNGESDENA